MNHSLVCILILLCLPYRSLPAAQPMKSPPAADAMKTVLTRPAVSGRVFLAFEQFRKLVRVRMAIGAVFAESRPLKRVGSVRLATPVALAATRFDVSRFEPVARPVMVEGDADPTFHRVALLAAAIFHEAVQFAAVGIIVAIYTQG